MRFGSTKSRVDQLGNVEYLISGLSANLSSCIDELTNFFLSGVLDFLFAYVIAIEES